MRRVCFIFTSLTPHTSTQPSAGFASLGLALTQRDPDIDLSINSNNRRKALLSVALDANHFQLCLATSNLLDIQDSML
jgi:hypothetical protein